jgi:regulator of protease activity HflC (stomatin/prohibitin superfamily)
MSLLIISIIVSVILGGIIAFAAFENFGGKGIFAFPLGAFGLLLLLFGSFTKINANEVGIIYDDRHGVLEEVKYEGFQTKSIFEHITKISTTNKTTQITVSGQTNDSAYADFIITVVYKIEAVNAGKFYKVTSSKDVATEQLTSMVKEALQSSTIQYDIYSILGDKLEEVRVDFTSNLSQIMMDRYSVTVISTSFDDIDAGERIENIIKNKAEALQQIEIAEAEKQKAQVEKETELIKAETQAQSQKIQAEAEAEVKKIAADAEAYKVETEKTAVTDMIDKLYEKYNSNLTYDECAQIVLQTIFYEKWNGELPEVLTSDNLSSLIGSLINKGE